MQSLTTFEVTHSMNPKLEQRYPGVTFGNHPSIGSNVRIGTGTIIGHNVVLHDDTIIGNDVRIDDGSVVGKLPLRSRLSAVTRSVSLSPAVVGDRSLLGTYAVLYRGATIGEDVLIADFASVREQTSIGDLTIIGRGVAIENQVRIGMRCKIETGAYITAMSTIQDLCFVAPEVTLTNDNYIGRTEERLKHFRGATLERGARIGANATVLPGVVIGADALVAAGSVVTRHVVPRMIAMGAPARLVRVVPSEQLLPALLQMKHVAGEV